MKYSLYKFILAIFAFTSIVSCGKNYLDEDPYSSYRTGATDPQTIEAQVIGLHRIFAELWGWSGRQGFISCWQIGMDITSAGATEGVENPFFQYANLNAENGGVSFMWEKCYDFINHANIIIDAVGDNNQQAAAEARFFRAYAYNILVTLWGDVPLLDAPVTSPTFNYTRQPVTAVNELIETDLDYAITYLPDMGQAKRESRINKDMARQLAAEAYLRMGMQDDSYFSKAEKMASDIINNTSYQLITARYGKYLGEAGDFYRDMFRFGNQRRSEGNTEAIWTFELEYNRDVNGGTIDNPQQRRVWQPGYHKWDGMVNADSLGGRGNGRLRLSNYMKYTVWKGLDGDVRNSNFNIRRTTNYNRPGFSATIGITAAGFRVASNDPSAVTTKTIKTGDQVIPYAADSLEVWYPYPTKWGGYDPADDFGYAVVKDWPVMRLGETYLLRAEARLRQNNPEGAASDINVLRDRAFKAARTSSGNPNLGKVTASEMNINFILDERARELISEENRRMTLVRTGTLADRIALNGDAGPADKVTSGFQDFNVLLPIPLSDKQLNKDAILDQNDGYN